MRAHLLLAKTYVLFGLTMPFLGAFAGEMTADDLQSVARLVIQSSPQIIQTMADRSLQQPPLGPFVYPNESFSALFDLSMMRDGIETPLLRVERSMDPSECHFELVRLTPLYYCEDDRSIVMNLAPEYLDVATTYGQATSLGRTAIACMIAHEVGHHLLESMAGSHHFTETADDPDLKRRMDYREELNADFFAGAFMAIAQQNPTLNRNLKISSGIESCVRMMRLIGTDMVNVPSSLRDHGTSAQREYWFRRGYQSRGNIRFGDTFTNSFEELMTAQ